MGSSPPNNHPLKMECKSLVMKASSSPQGYSGK